MALWAGIAGRLIRNQSDFGHQPPTPAADCSLVTDDPPSLAASFPSFGGSADLSAVVSRKAEALA
jgi:hypothetical protein